MPDRTWIKRNTERRNYWARQRRANINKRREIEKEIKKLSSLGKLTKDGKKICVWEDCNIILSRYNNDQCCAKHQKTWFSINKQELGDII